MDRRVLGCLATGVHLVLATGLAGVVTLLGWALLELLWPRIDVFGLPAEAERALQAGLPFAASVLLLALWNAGMLFIAGAVAQRSIAEAQEGSFLRASERVRAVRDREPWLRMLGMGGGAFARLRLAEAYALAAHGATDEAARIALEEARFPLRPGLARASAVVAAMAAVDSGDGGVWQAIASHLAWAERTPSSPVAQSLLTCRGQAHALTLELDRASAIASTLETHAPGSRGAALLRGIVAGLRGAWDDADRELLAARATNPFGPDSRKPVPPYVNHPIDAMRSELARDRGDLAAAVSLAEALAAQNPAHRAARLCVAAIRGERAASTEDAAGVRSAFEALEEIASRWSFSATTLASVAMVRARLFRLSGGAAAGLAAVPSEALRARLPALRQRVLLEAGECAAAAGDTARAAALFGEAAGLSAETAAGRAAAGRVVSSA